MKLNLKTQPDPVLREVSDPQTKEEIIQSGELYKALIDTMLDWDTNVAHKDEHAVAIAAIQVGIKKRITILRHEALKDLVVDRFDDTQYVVFVNPEIVARSKELEIDNEGCLSVPGFYGLVSRPSWVRIRYTTTEGEKRTLKAKGFLARIFIHEIEHMHGILFTDNVDSNTTDNLLEFDSSGALVDTTLNLKELLSKYANKEFKK